MNLRNVFSTAMVWAVPLIGFGVVPLAQAQDGAEAGMQVLTRGPVHEAFAEASMSGGSAGFVVKKAPYAPIAELPPDQQPDGANVNWIPGYWSWDDDRTDYIWVSGVWRDVPPGRQWIPGYWATVSGGMQWISGYWGDIAQEEVVYLPPPPESLEAGPSSPAPRPGNLWTPGCWVWQQSRYDWQPGYWVPQQQNWVWSPAHYTWTPRGSVYVPGYWDYDIVNRGVIFAPVYYQQPIYTRPQYRYSPVVVISLGAIVASLFVQPRSHHYYFGDYYDRRYEEQGYFPWHSRRDQRYGDDPIFVHYRESQLRRDSDWDKHEDERFRHRRDNEDARPPRTLDLQRAFFKNRKGDAPEGFAIGRDLAEAVRSSDKPGRFRSINMDERKRMGERGDEVRRFQSERARLESAPADAGDAKAPRDKGEPARLRMPRSPVAATTDRNVEGVRALPPRPESPKPKAVERGRRPEKPADAQEPRERKTDRETPVPQDRPQAAEPVKVERPRGGQKRPTRVERAPQRMEAKPEREAEKAAPKEAGPKPERAEPREQPVRMSPAKRRPREDGASVPAKPGVSQEKQREKAPARQAPKAAKLNRDEPKAEAPVVEPNAEKPERGPQKPAAGSAMERGKRGSTDATEEKKGKRGKQR